MNDILIAVIVCAMSIMLPALICVNLPSLKKEKNRLMIKSGIFFGIALLCILVYSPLLRRITDYAEAPSPAAVAVLTIGTYFGFVISGFISKETMKKFAVRIGVICIAAFVAETFFFNFKSISVSNEKISADFSSAQTDSPDTVAISADSVVFSGNGNLILNVNAENMYAVKFDFEGNDTLIRCIAEMKDGNFTAQYINIAEKLASADKGTAEFTINTYEKLNTFKLSLSDVGSPVTIKACTFSTVLPFRFSALRFIFVFVLLAAICAISTFRLHRITYNPSSVKHNIAILAALAACLSFVTCFDIPDQELINYDEIDPSYHDPFVQMFDAVHNGRVNIDIDPTPELLAMENPYDTSQRAALGVNCAWDRAFYEGKYYSYYGIAPVFVFYYPVYLFTGKLPTLNMANVFFGFLSVIFLFGAILAFTRRFIKTPNLMLLISAMVAACFSSGIYFLLHHSNMYTLPGLASTCFLMLCLWMGFEACNQKKTNAKRLILFALCGIAFVLSVASRPTRALSALLIAPTFLALIFNKKETMKSKISSAASFLIPVAIGAVAIMMYNDARFGSPFEFGAVYQLTVSNVKANGIKLSLLPYALLQYFLQPLSMTKVFPYVGFTSTSLSGYGQYIYSDSSHGALMFPLLLAGVIVLPFMLRHLRKQPGTKFIFDEKNVKKLTYIIMIVIALAVAWVDFCMAGVIYSYVCDILPILSLLSVWLLLDSQQQMSRIPSVSGKATAIYTAACAVTVVIAFLEILTFYNMSLYHHFPNILYVLEDLICFWN